MWTPLRNATVFSGSKAISHGLRQDGKLFYSQTNQNQISFETCKCNPWFCLACCQFTNLPLIVWGCIGTFGMDIERHWHWRKVYTVLKLAYAATEEDLVYFIKTQLNCIQQHGFVVKKIQRIQRGWKDKNPGTFPSKKTTGSFLSSFKK